jgi:hypothetical protein
MSEVNNYSWDEATGEEGFRKILEEGNIGDIISYTPNNPSDNMTFKIVNGNVVNGKGAEVIGDYQGLFGPDHPNNISDEEEEGEVKTHFWVCRKGGMPTRHEI